MAFLDDIGVTKLISLISGKVPIGSVTTPKMNGSPTVGMETAFARGDHVHPSDTTKADKSSTVTNVSFNSSTSKIQKTINGSTTDVVGVASQSSAGLMSAEDKTKLDNFEDTPQSAFSIPMGHLDNTSSATDMTAQVDGITELQDGVRVLLENDSRSFATGATLNINDLGAKPLCSSMLKVKSTPCFSKGDTLLFVYNSTRVSGGCWVVYGGSSAGFGYGVCYNTATDKSLTVSIDSYELTVGGYVTVKFDADVAAGATLNISGTGAKHIVNSTATTYVKTGYIKAKNVVTFIYNGTSYCIVSIGRSSGLLEADFASSVQTSLGKADTALQADSLKTINGESLVGSGDIPISSGGSSDRTYHFTIIDNGGSYYLHCDDSVPVSPGEFVTLHMGDPEYFNAVCMSDPNDDFVQGYYDCRIWNFSGIHVIPVYDDDGINHYKSRIMFARISVDDTGNTMTQSLYVDYDIENNVGDDWVDLEAHVNW